MRDIVFLRMVFGTFSCLYALGDPVLDRFRPAELTPISTAIWQTFEPGIDAANSLIAQYVPAKLQRMHLKHPIAAVDQAVAKSVQDNL